MRRWVALALMICGLCCFVEGTWIYGKALLAQVLLRQAWSAARAGAEQRRPWPWADTWPVARLLSPRHAVDLVVLEGATGATTAFAPGRITGTARPGEAGNLALAAHRDTHFRFLEHLEPGEPLWLELPGGKWQRFDVVSARVVHHQDTASLDAEHDGLTLVTCYPFDTALAGGPLRYVVQARRIDAAT